MSSEDIIENIGSFGHWQRIIFVCMSIPDVFVTFAILLPVFDGISPEWDCADTNKTGNGSNSTSFHNEGDNRTILTKEGENRCDCEVKVFHGDITSIVTEFDLVCGKQFITEMISSITFAGLLIGAAVVAQMSDSFGRKKPFFGTVILMSIFSLISGFSVNWQMYAVLRFFTGFNIGGFFCLAGVYQVEFVGRKWRTLCGTLGFWALAEMLLALLAYFIRDWRNLTMCTSLIGFSMFGLWFIIPESPRWLIRSGHIEEAREVCTLIARKNGRPSADLSHFDKLLQDSKTNQELHKKYTYIHLFRNRYLFKLTVLTSVLEFVTFATYYNMAFNVKNLSGDRYLNMLFAGIVDWVAMLSVIIFTNIIGRRISMMSYLGIAVVAHIAIIITHVPEQEAALTHAKFIKGAALIGKAAVLSGMYVAMIWTAELFPTYVRNVGIGMCAVVGRIGALLAPQIIVLGYYFELAPYIVIIALCCVAIPVCCFLNETNGKPLPDDIESETDESCESMKSETTDIQ